MRIRDNEQLLPDINVFIISEEDKLQRFFRILPERKT